jgi:hypothetical protein
MAIDEKGLEAFRQIYKDTFDEDLSQEEIEQKARSLLALYLAIYGSPLQAVKEIELLESKNNKDIDEH